MGCGRLCHQAGFPALGQNVDGFIKRDLASYIAIVTAFSVVNATFLSLLNRWLMPTVIGSVGITLWVVLYTRETKTLEGGAAEMSQPS